MKLSDFATDLDEGGNRFVKAGFGGFAGAGKSRTATEFLLGAYKDLAYTAPVLIIDNETGSRWLKPIFNRAGIKAKLKETASLADIRTGFDLLDDGQISFLLIDSLTKVWYRFCREYREKNKRTFMELNDWGKVIPAWQEQFADHFVATRGSIVFTGRGGFTYEKEDDEKDPETGRIKKGAFVKSDVKMKLAGDTPFEPDLNVWMQRETELASEGLTVWREAHILKDRSGLLDGKTFKQPSYDVFRPFVQFLTEVPQGAVAGETSGKSFAPGENYDNYARKTEKQIALEEIQEELVKMHPGQTKEDKAAKATLLEDLFKTRSWTAVENLSLERLQTGRNQLWIKSRGHAHGEGPPSQGAAAPADPGVAPMEGPLEEMLPFDALKTTEAAA